MRNSDVYRYPDYYAIGYQWNTESECNFLEACLKAYGPAQATRLLDIGCGAGRHLTELAKRGYQMRGVDVSSEMIAYVTEETKRAHLNIAASVDDLRHLGVNGTYDLAFCFMDTFRFLLTNEEIVAHLRAVADRLAPGGLYVTDFWVPRQWDQIANEIHQWEQTSGDTTVRVFYLQHPDSVDPLTQTFEDELVFEIHKAGQTETIRGGRTRTRLILPQEFRSLVELSGLFDFVGAFSDFDPTKPMEATSMTWRMISVLRRRGNGRKAVEA